MKTNHLDGHCQFVKCIYGEKCIYIVYILCIPSFQNKREKRRSLKYFFFHNFFCLCYMNRFNSLKHMQQFDHIILIKRKKKIESKKYTLLFISNTSTINTQGNASLKLAKNQAKARQHPEVKRLPS